MALKRNNLMHKIACKVLHAIKKIKRTKRKQHIFHGIILLIRQKVNLQIPAIFQKYSLSYGYNCKVLSVNEFNIYI